MEIDQDVADFLEHHGVKGQRWGVRRTRRIQGNLDRIDRIARGTATTKDRLRLMPGLGLVGALTTQKQAQNRLQRAALLQKQVTEGRAKTQDILLKVQGIRIRDLNYHQQNN